MLSFMLFVLKIYFISIVLFFLATIHVDVFAQAARHGDIYARVEIWNNNNDLKKNPCAEE